MLTKRIRRAPPRPWKRHKERGTVTQRAYDDVSALDDVERLRAEAFLSHQHGR